MRTAPKLEVLPQPVKKASQAFLMVPPSGDGLRYAVLRATMLTLVFPWQLRSINRSGIGPNEFEESNGASVLSQSGDYPRARQRRAAVVCSDERAGADHHQRQHRCAAAERGADRERRGWQSHHLAWPTAPTRSATRCTSMRPTSASSGASGNRANVIIQGTGMSASAQRRHHHPRRRAAAFSCATYAAEEQVPPDPGRRRE